jgi:hypothetical protein
MKGPAVAGHLWWPDGREICSNRELCLTRKATEIRGDVPGVRNWLCVGIRIAVSPWAKVFENYRPKSRKAVFSHMCWVRRSIEGRLVHVLGRSDKSFPS